jgi:DNA-binding NarL/FixJ family response regulator
LRPCVLLVDQSFVERQDPAWFAETIEFGRAVQVLVYVPMELPAVVEKLLRMGCMGVLSQNVSPRNVRRAIQAVTGGQIWAGRQVLSGMLQAELMSAYPRRLTARETEILRLIAKGFKNREIAEKLFISRETVRWHVRSLYSKIGVQDRLSATFYATEHGYLRSDTNAKTEAEKKPPKSLGPVPSANTTAG